MAAFWIILALALIALVSVWLWADKRSRVKRDVRGHGLDQAMKNSDASATAFRHQTRGPGSPGNHLP